MDWVKLVFFSIVPLFICIYTVNFGRWLVHKEYRFGGIAAMGVGIASLIIPIAVFISKIQ